jgi:hypothetical protein
VNEGSDAGSWEGDGLVQESSISRTPDGWRNGTMVKDYGRFDPCAQVLPTSRLYIVVISSVIIRVD